MRSFGKANLLDLAPWALAVALVGLACVAYGVLVERRWYRRRRYRVELLPDGDRAALTVLHLSDLHFVAGDPQKARFLATLPRPDLTVVTGDFLGEPEGVEDVVAALRPLRGRLASYFVLGSNDYYAPQLLNYAAYFSWRRRPRRGVRGRPGDLVAALEADGWTHLRNRKDHLVRDGREVEAVGLDDPHIERHDLRVVPRDRPGCFGLAVVHSPDPVPELVAMGYDLVLAGHTHGGQVRFPLVGALVTNSTAPRRMAMGLFRVGDSFVHVSPGLGTSKFAPFRFLCRPEATLIELAAAGSDGRGRGAGGALTSYTGTRPAPPAIGT